MTERSRLLRLLLMVQSAYAQLDEPVTYSAEAIRAAGFSTDPPPPAPDPRIEGRRILAWIEERELRRRRRRR